MSLSKKVKYSQIMTNKEFVETVYKYYDLQLKRIKISNKETIYTIDYNRIKHKKNDILQDLKNILKNNKDEHIIERCISYIQISIDEDNEIYKNKLTELRKEINIEYCEICEEQSLLYDKIKEFVINAFMNDKRTKYQIEYNYFCNCIYNETCMCGNRNKGTEIVYLTEEEFRNFLNECCFNHPNGCVDIDIDEENGSLYCRFEFIPNNIGNCNIFIETYPIDVSY